MLKMYSAEVLSKFPVVQHFPFGSLFSWEQDADAAAAPSTAHTSSQPSSHAVSGRGNLGTTTSSASSQDGVKASWPQQSSMRSPGTAAPWASPSTGATQSQMPSLAPTRAPWANDSRGYVAPLGAPAPSAWPPTSSDNKNFSTRALRMKSTDLGNSSQR